VENRQLGRTGIGVSSIGLGCVTFGREIDRTTSFAILDHAFEHGITLLDTAAVYGDGASETVLGEWLADRGVRDRVVLATKVSRSYTRDAVLESVENSLRRLRTDHIDLLQFHTWVGDTPLDEALGALDRVVQEGKVRAVGCSNWTAEQVAQALGRAEARGWARFEAVQPPYSLVRREIEADLLPLCADHGLGVVTYSPLGAGFLTGKYRQDGPVPEGTRFDVIPGHQGLYFNDHCFRVMEGLRQLADDTDRSMIQLALAWVLGRLGVTSVLVGARRPDHVDQAFEAERAGLPPDIRNSLDEL